MTISIGEVLWDRFEDKKIIGGAPLNVAYHLKSLGISDVRFISRIGLENGFLDTEILSEINKLGLSIFDIQTDEKLHTGSANVLFKDEEPFYKISENVAWDNIQIPKIDYPFSLVFSSLAQRSEESRKAIRKLWEKASLIFYDVNLRMPFTTKEIVISSLVVSNIVKMNKYEFETVCEWLNIDFEKTNDFSKMQESAEKIRKKYNFIALSITNGEKGACVVTRDEFFIHNGFKVKVVDTVGSGDAFFSALIAGYLQNKDWNKILEEANLLGALVASNKGAIL